MFSEGSSSGFENDFQTKGAIPKSTSSKLTSKSFEQKQGNTKNESISSQSSEETVKPYNFRLSRSKYANLIDETDIKWWTDIQAQARRLAAGQDDLIQQTTVELAESQKPKEQADQKDLLNAPICCPIMNCKILFWPNDMMLHFLSYHDQPIGRVFEKQRLLITLTPFELDFDEVCCVGVVSYAGKESTSDVSSVSNLWMPQNLKHCKPFTRFMYDYPIFVLASIVPLDVFIRPKAELKEFECNNICASMLVLWLAGAQSNTKIFCTITAFNDQLTNSKSGIYDVRELIESQCPYEFCNKDSNYFRLNFKELYALLRDEKTLQIELLFQEDLENGNKE